MNFPTNQDYIIIENVIDSNNYKECINLFIEEYKQEKYATIKQNILDSNPKYTNPQEYSLRKQYYFNDPTKNNELMFLFSFHKIMQILFPLHYIWDYHLL